MSDPQLRDPARADMFPVLTGAQIKRLAALGKERLAAEGEILFDQGTANASVFVVLEGAVDVVHPLEDGHEEPVTREGPGEFTGEANVLSDRPSVVRGRVIGPTKLLEIDRPSLHKVVQTDAELSEIMMRAFLLRHAALVVRGMGNVVLVGSRHSAGTSRLQEFLSRNGHPYRFIDVDLDPDVQSLLDRFHMRVQDVPVLICRDHRVHKNPSNAEVAACLGLSTRVEEGAIYDVVVVGAGPSGLAAAVYAASEGLKVIVLEAHAPGGQAGSSSRIENYLGFPTGVSGEELADRALAQAEKFGAQVSIAQVATQLFCERRPYRVKLFDGQTIETRTMVIASGAQYRKLTLPELGRFEGAGVFYSATHLEAALCNGEEVAIVGGGNSAGQAAVYLAATVKRLHILVRGEGLAATMSRYLIRRIEETPNIELHALTEIEALEGETELERLRWRTRGKDPETHPIRHLFVMTGASPQTSWLQGCVALDEKGFVRTGVDLKPEDLKQAAWSPARAPWLLETTLPGVFAVGDVRANSVKRVASAVGEGSTCIQFVHKVLAE